MADLVVSSIGSGGEAVLAGKVGGLAARVQGLA